MHDLISARMKSLPACCLILHSGKARLEKSCGMRGVGRTSLQTDTSKLVSELL